MQLSRPIFVRSGPCLYCLGSYHFGCDGGDFGDFFTPEPGKDTTPEPAEETTTLPSLECPGETAKNPLGDCGGCNQQYFVSQNCRESFLCTSQVQDPSNEGCYLTWDGRRDSRGL